MFRAFGVGLASIGLVSGLVEPQPCARGSLDEAFHQFPHTGSILPAAANSETHIRELEKAISLDLADVIVLAKPVDLKK